MGRPGITYSEVANAAQQISARGSNPTIESIRAILKSGSSGTIAQHLRNWKTRQDSTSKIATKENLPEEMVALMKGLWEKLVNQADDQVHAIQQSTEQSITQLKQTVEKLQQENNQWQQQCHLLKQERDSFSHEKTVLEQLLNTYQTDLATLQTKLNGSAEQLNEKQTRIDELHRMNQQVQANLEHYRESSREQRLVEQQQVEQQQRQLEQTLMMLQKNNSALQHQIEQSHVQQNAVATELTTLIATYSDAKTRLELLEKERVEIEQTRQHWQSLYETEKIKLNKQSDTFIQLQTEMATLTEKFLTTDALLKEITAQNKLLASEKWELGQEKAQLQGQLQQLHKHMLTYPRSAVL